MVEVLVGVAVGEPGVKLFVGVGVGEPLGVFVDVDVLVMVNVFVTV